MEVPRLGVESDLQLPAYTTATMTRDPSLVCNLHGSSQQHQIPNPLNEARDGTQNLTVTSQIHFCCSTRELQGFFVVVWLVGWLVLILGEVYSFLIVSSSK